MNDDLEKKLYTAFPRLFRPRGKPRVRLTGYGIQTGDGWYRLIYELCEQIQKHADEKHFDVLATQVKEKFGGLRFYLRGADEHIDKLIEEAELKSCTMCEVCGEPGARRTSGGWLRTMCDKHNEEYLREWGNDEEGSEC